MSRRVLAAAAAVVVGAVIGGALAVVPGDRAVVATAPPVPQGSVVDHVPAPELELADERGAAVRLRALRGRPVVVTFMTAACDDTCPLMAQQIRGALDRLGRDVPAIAIAVDPARDTPARARAFLRAQRMEGRLRFALGTRDELRRAWRGFGVDPLAGGAAAPHVHAGGGRHAHVTHQVRIVLLDARGAQRVGYAARDATPEAIAHDLRALEREAHRG